ncbi:Myosin-2 heavy chain-like protein [Melia azedarach]|uniref:Myosin-2 heavy chain-like protein n=1 Tax=Melia azedarach TaxID=155640 RepID=A0ACC1XYF0_MELAZ|nr:Myosin-2 heavy chain-like protein [Melia azedarach]
MDLGCLDMGCISVSDKLSNETVTDSPSNKESNEPNDPRSANSKHGKSKSPRGNNQPSWNALNKCTSQIKKPPHRKSSPLNWFPRKKVDSYLKRKIKMLQEVDGMNLTLDETLGDTNPHYSRVLREKIAAREAAQRAMEARKAALVEASWCRILRAARIQSKEAEALLLKSEKAAAEAFEAATAKGVIMYDKPNCPQAHCQIETSSVNGGGSSTHTVTASFETAFAVDKEVATAVKTAFVKLANYPPFSKDEFKDLLHEINENPDTALKTRMLRCQFLGMRLSKSRSRQSSENLNRVNLVEMMLERLKCLQEDELSSLATIVATCGLNAALAEVENSKMRKPSAVTDFPCASVHNSRRISSLGAGTMSANLEYFVNGSRKKIESELPSLDKCLVKHMSKLEREVQEAKNTKMKESTGENRCKTEDGNVKVDNGTVQSETTSDLESVLLKHSWKFVKEIEEAKKNSRNNFEIGCQKSEARVPNEQVNHRKKDVPDIPSLDKFLVKHVSRLEKEVQEAKNNRNNDLIEEAKDSRNNFETASKNTEGGAMPNEAAATHRKEAVPEVSSLDKFLVKRVSGLEKEVQQAKSRRNNDPVDGSRATDLKKKNVVSSFSEAVAGKENIDLNKEDGGFPEIEQKDTKIITEETFDSLDKILVKPVHMLEREKMQALSSGNNDRNHRLQRKQRGNNDTYCDGLDKVLVKHVSRLEKEQIKFNENEEAVKFKRRMHSQSQMKEEEGSLDQVLVKHKSRLEREKLAAIAQQAEEQIQSRPFVSRREARERELQEAWGGLSLGNSIRPHLSKLERDKAAWIKAEEEERRQAMRDVM